MIKQTFKGSDRYNYKIAALLFKIYNFTAIKVLRKRGNV